MLACSEGSGESAHLQRRFFRLFVLVFRDLRQLVRRNPLFRLFAKRYFVFSLFRVALYLYFLCLLGGILSFQRAITTGGKTEKN